MRKNWASFSWAIGFLSSVVFSTCSAWAATPTAQQAEFFEKKVQPILLNHCYKCHSEAGATDGAKIKGGLRLDTREGLLKGGDSGAAIAPGKPDGSLLIKAVRYTDPDLQMPPNDRKLSADEIADLERWVAMGAPDPRSGPATRIDLYALEKARATNHWAFQPIFPPQPPAVADTNNWIQSPIDQYILADLAKKGIQPAKKADKLSLIRRAHFDLTGLPPTPSEVDEFVSDTSVGAFTNVVDRLLASPRYGERWGRYWLDLARYADTKGSGMDDQYVGSHTYRDYVIQAFNDDLPYDQFLLQQIAADKLPGGDKKNLAALGFLTLGNRFNNNADDIIADRIDVVSKATLGLTMTCARCHDHKFDPIPTMDYYSWHGIFNSSYEPDGGAVIDSGSTNQADVEFQAALQEKTKLLQDFKRDARIQVLRRLAASGGDYLLALAEADRPTNTIPRNSLVANWGLNRRWADGWDSAVKKARASHDRILAPWVDFSSFPENEWPARAPGLLAGYRSGGDGAKGVNARVARMLTPLPSSLKQLSARYSAMFGEVEDRWISAAKQAAARKEKPKPFSDAALEEIRQLFHDSSSPVFVSEKFVDDTFNRDNRIRNRVQSLEKAITDLETNHPGAPRRAVVLFDKKQPQDSPVYLRGNPGSRGPAAPRRFLEILSGDDRPIFRDGSGRLELAQAIATDENPLTSRVMVNRVWQGHFGEGLVRTPSDFGVHSEKPSHPALLDYLAWTLIEDGWSIKKLHRRIMFSGVYQQSSDDNPRHAQLDPGNRLLWRMNRRRLDFEALRDTILFIGGRIDFTMGGPPVKLDSVPFPTRRTVYGFVDRGKLPGMHRAFDFANPDLSVGKRDITTVPQQALFLMNSPLVVEQAVNLVRRPDFTALSKAEDRIRLLYRLIYQRQPTETELRLSLKYVELEPRMPKSSVSGESPWEYGIGQFDAAFKRVRGFAALEQFSNNSWRGPGGAALSAEGGHASALLQAAVIRRWNAPSDGKVAIEGRLQHSGDGDGVQGLVVSSRTGTLGAWVALNSAPPMAIPPFDVQEGDTIDFMVYARSNAKGDDFFWRPIISFTDPSAPDAAPRRFDAGEGFQGGTAPRYHVNAWQKFAQVLLQTNELTFWN